MSDPKDFLKQLKDDKKNDCFIYMGKEARVYVPHRYTIHDLLFIADTVQTLGIFSIHSDGKEYNLLFPVMLEMCPSDIIQQRVDDVDYFVLIFRTGDIFINNKTIVKQGYILAKLFIEFTRNGNIPKFVPYEKISMVLDTAQPLCGVTLRVPHAVFEMMAAFQSRDPDNLNIQYRYTDMKKPVTYLGLRNTTAIRDSTTSSLLGSYFIEGLNRSIINQSDRQHEVEDLLRI